MNAPQWQTSASNIDRTNNIFRRIVTEFGPQFQTVAAIQPVNEFVPRVFWRRRVVWLTTKKKKNLGPPGIIASSCSIPLANTT
jgi:hypothetical protein